MTRAFFFPPGACRRSAFASGPSACASISGSCTRIPRRSRREVTSSAHPLRSLMHPCARPLAALRGRTLRSHPLAARCRRGSLPLPYGRSHATAPWTRAVVAAAACSAPTPSFSHIDMRRVGCSWRALRRPAASCEARSGCPMSCRSPAARLPPFTTGRAPCRLKPLVCSTSCDMSFTVVPG